MPASGLIAHHLARIVQEAAHNALSHGKARTIVITVVFVADILKISIVDDGSGFDTTTAAGPDAGHFGVQGMRERARKIGGTTLRSIGDIARHQRLQDDDRETLTAEQMFAELHADSGQFTRFLRSAHDICEKHKDVATTSLLEGWIDEAERRTWFLAEITSAPKQMEAVG